jgi:hypothetical protein
LGQTLGVRDQGDLTARHTDQCLSVDFGAPDTQIQLPTSKYASKIAWLPCNNTNGYEGTWIPELATNSNGLDWYIMMPVDNRPGINDPCLNFNTNPASTQMLIEYTCHRNGTSTEEHWAPQETFWTPPVGTVTVTTTIPGGTTPTTIPSSTGTTTSLPPAPTGAHLFEDGVLTPLQSVTDLSCLTIDSLNTFGTSLTGDCESFIPELNAGSWLLHRALDYDNCLTNTGYQLSTAPCTTAAHWTDRNIDGLKFAIRPTTDETMCLELGGPAAFLKLGCTTPTNKQLWYDAAKVPDAKFSVSASFNRVVAAYCRLTYCSSNAIESRRSAAIFERTKGALSGAGANQILRDSDLVLFGWGTVDVPDLISRGRVRAVVDRIDTDLNSSVCGPSCSPVFDPERSALALSVDFGLVNNAMVAVNYMDGQSDLTNLKFPGPPALLVPRPVLSVSDSYQDGIARWAIEGNWAISDGKDQTISIIRNYQSPMRTAAEQGANSGRWWWTFVPGLNLVKVMQDCRLLGEQAAARNTSNFLSCGVSGFLAGATTFVAAESLVAASRRVLAGMGKSGRLSVQELDLAFVNHVDEAAAGIKVDDVGLGLKGSSDVGGIPNQAWVARGLADDGPFVRRFYQALYRSTSRGGRIRFNLDGLDVAQALRAQRFSDPFLEGVGVTNWELQQVLAIPQFRSSVIFYRGGLPLSQLNLRTLGLL